MNINSPVAVHNSWVKVKLENHYVVHRIAAGGDHCYILVSKKVSGHMHNTGNFLQVVLWVWFNKGQSQCTLQLVHG